MTKATKNVASLQFKSLGYTAKANRALVDGKGNEKIFLARMGGIAKEVFTGEGKNGQWWGFKGTFAALTKDGDQVISNTAFFPSNITSRLVEQFNNGVVDIEVTADIFIVETDKNASGYAYLCEPVLTAENTERMAKISAHVFDQPLPTALQIAAPVEENVNPAQKAEKKASK